MWTSFSSVVLIRYDRILVLAKKLQSDYNGFDLKSAESADAAFPTLHTTK